MHSLPPPVTGSAAACQCRFSYSGAELGRKCSLDFADCQFDLAVTGSGDKYLINLRLR